MAESNPNVVSASSAGPRLPDGVIAIESIATAPPGGWLPRFHALQRSDRSVERLVRRHVRPRSRLDVRIRRISTRRKSS